MTSLWFWDDAEQESLWKRWTPERREWVWNDRLRRWLMYGSGLPSVNGGIVCEQILLSRLAENPWLPTANMVLARADFTKAEIDRVFGNA